MSWDQIRELNNRYEAMRRIRDPFMDDWKPIYEQLLPYRPRWNLSDHGQAQAKDTKIINSTPVRALRTMCAGFMASITSPSRIWFRLTTSRPQLQVSHRIKAYLSECERSVREGFIRSRFYQCLADGIYPDLSAIAVSALVEEADPMTGVRFEGLLPGEYLLAVNNRSDVDTLFHEWRMEARQMVQEFGFDRCSAPVQNAWRRGQHEQTFDVRRAIFPRKDWVFGAIGGEQMPVASQWWEPSSNTGKLLRDSGYEENPIIAPRWNARSREPYGRGAPGWECKSDCRGLQAGQKVLIKLLDKAADPPLRASDELMHGRVSLVPGDVTYGKMGTGPMVEPIHLVTGEQIRAARENVQDHQDRVNSAFFVDLWLAMLLDERNQRPTATEVQERRNEVMLQLGPMLENLNTGLLEPAVTRTFQVLNRSGWLPDPPEELAGEEVSVEFISILHQAQKMTGIAGIRELLSNVGALAQIGKVDALEKVNSDKVVDELTEMLGIRPDLVYSEDEVVAIRKAKANQEQAAQQGQAMLTATEGARNLSGIDPQQIQDVAGAIAPMAAAAGGLT